MFLNILLVYAPTVILLGLSVSVRQRAASNKVVGVGVAVMVLVLAVAGILLSGDSGYSSPVAGCIYATSLVWLTGPMLIVATRKKWKPIWSILPCVLLPIPSWFLGYMFIAVTGQLQRF